MADRKQGKPMNLEIQADDQTAMGQYINMAIVQHSSSEFVLDFIFIAPGQKARLRSRSIIAPEHAKRLLKALQENITKYEERFGEITVPEAQPGMMAPPSNTVQ
mgnify:CR=1 FL=1